MTSDFIFEGSFGTKHLIKTVSYRALADDISFCSAASQQTIFFTLLSDCVYIFAQCLKTI